MKVVVVAPKINLETGGGSHFTLALVCRGLQERGVEVTVCSLVPTAEPSAEALRKLGITLVDLPAGPAAAAAAAGRIAAAIHVAYGPLPIAFDLKRRDPGRRVVAYLNTLSGFCTNVLEQRDGCWLTCGHRDRVRHHSGRPASRLAYLATGWRRVAVLARGYRTLDAVAFDSAPLRDAYGPIYRVPVERTRVIPECIDFEAIRLAAAPRARTGDAVEVLFVAALAPYKGAGLLLDALRRVRVPWRLSVFGDGPDRPMVEAFRAERPDQVVFHGHVDNRRLFAQLAGRPFVFVHPCLWFEAFGRAVIEAMALGLPVVVPDVGGPAWLVDDGVSGLHYRHRDAAALARRIEWAAEHPDEIEAIGERGVDTARRFDYRMVAALWHETLAELAA
ncbi:MAG: glycosyltransferase family 4 protein [Candidatus Rokuibacteriota bacterium]